MSSFGRHRERVPWYAAVLVVALCAPDVSGGNAVARQAAIAQAEAPGLTRVIVELRVNDPDRARGIAEAQRDVLSRLAATRVTVVRQYRTVPMMALEVDSAALAQLTQMGDLVTRVIPDSVSRPQEAR